MLDVGYGLLIFSALLLGRSHILFDMKRRYFEPGMIPFSALMMSLCLFIHLFSINPWIKAPLWGIYGYFGGILTVALSVLFKQHGMQRLAHQGMLSVFVWGCAYPFIFFQGFGFWGLLGLVHAVFFASLYALWIYPKQCVRTLLYFLVISVYKLKAYHLENLPQQGGVLLLGNHVSYIDWAFVQLFCPRVIRFVMHRNFYDIWYLTWLFKCFDLIPIANGASQEAIEEIRITLSRGDVIGLFPEGRLTHNGQMTIFRTGFERAVTGVDAVIVPFYLQGLWGSKFTQASHHYRHWLKVYKKEVSLVYGKALPIHSKAFQVQQKVRELSIDAWQLSCQALDSIPVVWLTQVKRKYRACAMKDLKGRSLSHAQVLEMVLRFRHKIRESMGSEKRMGLMLPTSNDAVILNLAILSMGLPLIHLNPSWSEEQLLKAASALQIDTIITTSELMEDACSGLKAAGIRLLDLDDMKFGRSRGSRFFYAALICCLPVGLLNRLLIDLLPSETIAIIQVVYEHHDRLKITQWSHAAILASIHQAASVFCLNQRDLMLNVMPFSNLSGLTISTLMPLVEGIPIACYPDAADALGIARLTLVSRATLMLASPPILENLLSHEAVHARMLDTLRYILSVGDRISASLHEQFRNTFHKIIHEGYNALDLAPLVSCNVPDVICTKDWNVHRAHKPGTMGLPLPGYAFRVVEPAGFEDLPVGEIGLVLIGSMAAPRTEKTEHTLYHWYATSVRGFLDQEGYLSIVQEQ